MLEMMDAAATGELKALWAIGYDIALTNADASSTERALRCLDFVVVQDMFLNETARQVGDVFLPVASSFERDGTFMNAERRIQRIRKAIDPFGASDAQIRQRVDRLAHQESYLRVRSFEFSHSVVESLAQTRVVMPLNPVSFEQRLNLVSQRL